MAAWRYEISSRVEKYFTSERERTSEVCPSVHVMFCLLYKHQWTTKPFHFNSFFGMKGAIYYVVIATVIYSHVNITCYFHMWRYEVFARKLTWYFIGDLYNKYILKKFLYKYLTNVRFFLSQLLNWSNGTSQGKKCNRIHFRGKSQSYGLHKHLTWDNF